MKIPFTSNQPANEETDINPISMVLQSREVSERAYFSFLNAGGTHGHDREDWFQAEKELMLGQPRTKVHGSHN